MKSGYSFAVALVVLACMGCKADPPVMRTRSAEGVPPTVGTNLAPMSDWSSELTSVDLFKGARAWTSGTEELFEDDRTLDLDDAGWVRSLLPGQVARTVMLSNGARYPTGDYVVLYEGSGTLEFNFSGKTERVESDASGRYVLEVDQDRGGFSVMIVETEPRDYLRNLHIIMPGGACDSDGSYCDERAACAQGSCVPFEESYREQIFYPEFIDSLRGYGVLRFMDWMQTNGSPQRSWADRPTDRLASWTSRGVPVEVMVELANRSAHDPWFCMPHLADDDYVENFARYVADHLAPDRKVYVEYSNEVWNGLFPQAEYARAQGVAQGLGASEFDAQMRFYSRRASEVQRIWEQVFSATPSRLVRVAASQSGNDWVSSEVLGYGDLAGHVDVLAIAPYFGAELGDPEMLATVERMDLDALFSDLQKRAVPLAISQMAAHARVARRYGIELISYEGGQHLAGVQSSEDSDVLNELFDDANRDPRMKSLYAEYLQGWRKSGGHTFVHFSSCGFPTKFGRWGAREWLQQPREDAPKLDAILDFGEQNPRWW